MDNYRQQIPGLQQQIQGKPLVYFDWAATSQMPQVVLDATLKAMTYRGNVGRGVHSVSTNSTAQLERSREKIASFIGAKTSEVILTTGTTEGLNLVADNVGSYLQKDEMVVLSLLEHHANWLPWQKVTQDSGARLETLALDQHGRVDLQALERLLQEASVTVVVCSLVSNVLGTRQPMEAIVAMAKKYRVRVVVDAAQAVAHLPIDVHRLGVDALVFGGHKLFAPNGVGVLWVTPDWMVDWQPRLLGGGIVEEISTSRHRLQPHPRRFEAGTLNVPSVVGLARACQWIEDIGWEVIQQQERRLSSYLSTRLASLSQVRRLCAQPDIPLFSIVVDGLHPHDIGTLLDLEGIVVRTGHHCAQPLHSSLLGEYEVSTRLSLSFLNTIDECDVFIAAIGRIINRLGEW